MIPRFLTGVTGLDGTVGMEKEQMGDVTKWQYTFTNFSLNIFGSLAFPEVLMLNVEHLFKYHQLGKIVLLGTQCCVSQHKHDSVVKIRP